jgi:Tat protein translocase TatB subunit
MFGIGMPELLLILAVALIVLGPKKLPEIAKSLGKAMGEFKRATNDLKQTIEQETGLDEVRQSLNETKRDLQKSLHEESTSVYKPEPFDTQKTEIDAVEEDPNKPAPASPEDEPEKPKDDGAL